MTVAQRITRALFYLLILPITLGLCGWQGWRWWSWAIAPVQSPSELNAEAVDTSAVQIEIPPGTSAQQIGQDLRAVQLIRSATAWNLWTRWQLLQNRPGEFLAGTYELSPTEPMPEIANRIWSGETVSRQLTIPEGWAIQQMADYFEAEQLFSAEAFIQATQQIPEAEYPWLPDSISQLEGFLYPDTYALDDNITPEQMIRQMLDRFEQIALPVYRSSNDIPYTLLEWVTLSSIVEREAVISQERPLIASVFAKRLREGMTLGADPTVEYALGIQQTPEQPLTLEDVRTPSPYNTYINPGLPPGPIASPGLASLEASLNPEDTEYLYFVARYDGTHVFSRTLAEHEAAQARIRDGVDRAVDEAASEADAVGENDSADP
jgi:UPF0755 protein